MATESWCGSIRNSLHILVQTLIKTLDLKVTALPSRHVSTHSITARYIQLIRNTKRESVRVK